MLTNLVYYMDNLFGAVKLYRAAYFTLQSHIMLHGTFRTDEWRVISKLVVQKAVESDAQQNRVGRTTKAAVIEGDLQCP